MSTVGASFSMLKNPAILQFILKGLALYHCGILCGSYHRHPVRQCVGAGAELLHRKDSDL